MTRNHPTGLTRSALHAVFWFVCILSMATCSRATCRIKGTGTVKYLEMEGGFYGIEADSGSRYRPVNLQGEFAKGGLRVRFCANPVESVMSFQMWGIPVEIVDMEFLDTKGKSEPTAGPQNTWKPRSP